MDVYTRILAQTDLNSQLLLDGEWELSADSKHVEQEEHAARMGTAKEAARQQREQREREAVERDRADLAATVEAEERKGASVPFTLVALMSSAVSASRGSGKTRGRTQSTSGPGSRRTASGSRGAGR
jgi:hypothetical protein